MSPFVDQGPKPMHAGSLLATCGRALALLLALALLHAGGCAGAPRTTTTPSIDATSLSGSARLALGSYDRVRADPDAEIARMRAILRWENAHMALATRARRDTSAMRHLLALHERDTRLGLASGDAEAIARARSRLRESEDDLLVAATIARDPSILTRLVPLDASVSAHAAAAALMDTISADTPWCDAPSREGCARLYAASSPSVRARLELTTPPFATPPLSIESLEGLDVASSALVVRELALAAIARDDPRVVRLSGWMLEQDPLDLGAMTLELLRRDVEANRVDRTVFHAVATHDALVATESLTVAAKRDATLPSIAVALAYVALHTGLLPDAAAFVAPHREATDPLVRRAASMVDALSGSPETRRALLDGALATDVGCRSPYVTGLVRLLRGLADRGTLRQRANTCVVTHRTLVGPRFVTQWRSIERSSAGAYDDARLWFDDATSSDVVDRAVLEGTTTTPQVLGPLLARAPLARLVSIARTAACAEEDAPQQLCLAFDSRLRARTVITLDDLSTNGSGEALSWLGGRLDLPFAFDTLGEVDAALAPAMELFFESYENTAIALDTAYVEARARHLLAHARREEARRYLATQGTILGADTRAVLLLWLRDLEDGARIEQPPAPLSFFGALERLEDPIGAPDARETLDDPSTRLGRYARAARAFAEGRYEASRVDFEALADVLDGMDRVTLLGLAGVAALGSSEADGWGRIEAKLVVTEDGRVRAMALRGLAATASAPTRRRAIEDTWRVMPDAPLHPSYVRARYADAQAPSETDVRAVVLVAGLADDTTDRRCICDPATQGAARCFAQSRCAGDGGVSQTARSASTRGFAVRVSQTIAMRDVGPRNPPLAVGFRSSFVEGDLARARAYARELRAELSATPEAYWPTTDPRRVWGMRGDGALETVEVLDAFALLEDDLDRGTLTYDDYRVIFGCTGDCEGVFGSPVIVLTRSGEDRARARPRSLFARLVLMLDAWTAVGPDGTAAERWAVANAGLEVANAHPESATLAFVAIAMLELSGLREQAIDLATRASALHPAHPGIRVYRTRNPPTPPPEAVTGPPDVDATETAATRLAREATDAYLESLRAYEAQSPAYFDAFEASLTCFYGRTGVTRADVRRARAHFGSPIESIHLAVVRQGSDWVWLADYGVGGNDGYPAPYEKGVLLRRTPTGLRVAAEVSLRGPYCGEHPFEAPTRPDGFGRCADAHRTCMAPCRSAERAQGPSNGSEICMLACSQRLACCVDAASAEPDVCE